MPVSDQNRRSFLSTLGALGLLQALPLGLAVGQEKIPAGSVLGPDGGEHLLHFRDHGNIFIKGCSDRLAFGTQQVMRGTGIPTHRHPAMEEAFYVLDGRGTFTVDDVPHPFERGSTLYIPKNSWHGFANPDHELVLLWIVTPAGLEGFFRDTCHAPDAPPKNLTREQIRAIALKYGTEFR